MSYTCPDVALRKALRRTRSKKSMEDYYVRYETLAGVQEAEGRTIYITHTLPRRAGEMDLRIDDTPSQLCFDACGHGVTIRMALLASILG